jgi:ribonuclease P/MRP protein subunit POP1
VPGTPLKPTDSDNRVPILLIQRSVESSSDSSSGLHGWSLIIPAGWGMPFFSSLVYTGTRVGGQREREVQAFEAGMPCFPRDYPFTSAYASGIAKRAELEKARWERTPPAKRVNYDSLRTMSPWKPDWDVVLGISTLSKAREQEEGLLSTQRDVNPGGGGSNAININDGRTTTQDEQPARWLLRGVEVEKILRRLGKSLDPAASLLAEVDNLRHKRGYGTLVPQIPAEELLQGALVNALVVMTGRGAPEDLAMIYAVADNEARQWLKLGDRKNGVDDDTLEEKEVRTKGLVSVAS